MLEYNKDYVEAFRKLAVTKMEDFKVGNTYYGGHSAEEFTVKEILTDEECLKREGLSLSAWPTDSMWFTTTDNPHMKSCSDRNICEKSYNPWLIFTNKDIAEVYFKNLETWDGYDVFHDIDYYQDDVDDFDREEFAEYIKSND